MVAIVVVDVIVDDVIVVAVNVVEEVEAVSDVVDSVVSFDWLQKMLNLRWLLLCDESTCSLVFDL